jgi:hypothetical protein
MVESTAVCDWGRVLAEQVEDAGRLNSPSAIQPAEDDEMRSARRAIQAGRVLESTI